MSVTYQILGRAVPAHQLAIGTMGLVAFLVAPKPWNSSKNVVDVKKLCDSPEEEKFVTDYIASRSQKQ